MDASRFVGQLCAFTHAGARLCGSVVSTKPLPPTERGQIPNSAVTVRGRSGKLLTIDLVEQYASFYTTWDEAIADTKNTP